VTSSQIKNLATTPITVLAAQGANTIIMPYFSVAKLVYGGTSPFSNLVGLEIDYYDGSNGYQISGFPSSGFLDQTADTYFITATAPGGTTYTPAQCVNLPIVLSNPNTNITGNAANDNSLIIYLQYSVLSV
jgi:hypothetical protein